MLIQTVENCDNKLHVSGLSETWLTSQVPDNFMDINGFVCIRNDRHWYTDNRNHIKKGGGVCLYMNEHLHWSTESHQIHNRSNNDIEIQ